MATVEEIAAVEAAARIMGAEPDDRIPGLWHVPGLPELTTLQLVGVAIESLHARATNA